MRELRREELANLTREEKVKLIYDEIGHNQFVHDYMDGIAGYQYRTKYLFLGDIIGWFASQGEWSFTVRGNGKIDLGEGCIKVNFTAPIDKQPIAFVDNIVDHIHDINIVKETRKSIYR